MISSSLWNFFAEPLRRVAEEQREFLNSPQARRPDWQVIVVLVSTAFALTIQYYVFKVYGLEWVPRAVQICLPESVAEKIVAAIDAPRNAQLVRLAYWACGQYLVYVAIPLVVIKLVLRQSLRDYGLKLRGMLNYWWLYLVMATLMIAPVVFLSDRHGFDATYPFYRLDADEPLWPRFFIWEAFYFLQFAALEFFFRGYVLHGLRRRFGPYAIFVMTVPYCMIHFGKPMLEAVAAILAGIILGFMSLKTRSIWLGAALHVSVAATMDLAALHNLGRW